MMKLSHGSTDVTNLDKLFADGLGMSVLKGIDPVGTNLVAAGIFVGKNGQLPTLTRVEVSDLYGYSYAGRAIFLNEHVLGQRPNGNVSGDIEDSIIRFECCNNASN